MQQTIWIDLQIRLYIFVNPALSNLVYTFGQSGQLCEYYIDTKSCVVANGTLYTFTINSIVYICICCVIPNVTLFF